LTQRLDDGGIVYQLAARDIDEQSATLDPIELAFSDEMFRLRCMRRREHHDVAGREQAADADGGTLHPRETGGRREDVAIDERRERDVGVGQQTPERVAIPGFGEGVLRKVAAELVDEVPRHDPRRRGTDYADQDDRGRI
jgi:hypothetical protein